MGQSTITFGEGNQLGSVVINGDEIASLKQRYARPREMEQSRLLVLRDLLRVLAIHQSRLAVVEGQVLRARK